MKTRMSSNKVLNENGSHAVTEAGYLDEKAGVELTVTSHAGSYMTAYVSVGLFTPHAGQNMRLAPTEAATLRDLLTNALARLEVVAAAKQGGAQ